MPAKFSLLSPKGQKLLLISGLLLVLLLLIRSPLSGSSRKKNLSEGFTLDEFTVTRTGLRNVPDAASRANIEKAVKTFFQPLQDTIEYKITITSGYRSQAVNNAVRGVKTSKHLTGQGFDFKVVGKSGNWLYHKIVAAGLIDKVDFIQVHSTYIHIEL